MEIHSPAAANLADQMDQVKKNFTASQNKQKPPTQFVDPVYEFQHASRLQNTVRNWLTIPIEERKRIVREDLTFIPRQAGDPGRGVKEETEENFKSRQMDRWRALCVVIQEESRAKAGNRSVEVAIGALKHLFPEHDWNKK